MGHLNRAFKTEAFYWTSFSIALKYYYNREFEHFPVSYLRLHPIFIYFQARIFYHHFLILIHDWIFHREIRFGRSNVQKRKAKWGHQKASLKYAEVVIYFSKCYFSSFFYFAEKERWFNIVQLFDLVAFEWGKTEGYSWIYYLSPSFSVSDIRWNFVKSSAISSPSSTGGSYSWRSLLHFRICPSQLRLLQTCFAFGVWGSDFVLLSLSRGWCKQTFIEF
mgnify:FL=1